MYLFTFSILDEFFYENSLTFGIGSEIEIVPRKKSPTEIGKIQRYPFRRRTMQTENIEIQM